jgi:hypothetical protein
MAALHPFFSGVFDMKKFASMFAVVALALAGCGGDGICDDLKGDSKDLYEKTKACSSEPYEEPTDADVEQCEESIKSCSDSEKDKLQDFRECLLDLPNCTPATKDEFGAAFAGCAFTHLSSVSPECGASFGGESVREGFRVLQSR